MKKSKAISIIANTLVEKNVDLSQEEIIELSSTILMNLELAGMKPPGYTEYEQYGSGDEYECYAREIDGWEEE